MGKWITLALLGAIVAAVTAQWPELPRSIKIERM